MLITLPIGSVYAFSLFSTDIASAIGCTFKEVQFAFSLSIFFLGMGAAFGGSIVEKNIQMSARIAAALFAAGLALTAIGINIQSLPCIYVGYGFLCGIAQGIGYLTPVKTLLMWYPRHKGLATSISIISFGLGSGLCALLHRAFYQYTGIQGIFFMLMAAYFIMMAIGSMLIEKPYCEHEDDEDATRFNYKTLLVDKFFICSWLFMFINISAGLSLISSSVNIFKELDVNADIIVVLMTLAGIFNGSFRLVFAWLSDMIKRRIYAWMVISCMSIVLMAISSFIPIALVVSILLVNATYGGGFSTLPGILSEHYDLTCLSRVHGAVLSAWGIAGLVGNNISVYVHSFTGSFMYVPFILVCMYAINIIVVNYMLKLEKVKAI